MKRAIVALLVVVGLFSATFAAAGDITGTGMSQKDLVTYLTNIKTIVNNMKTQMNNVNLVSGAIAAGTADNTMKTAAAISYTIGGKLYNKAATDNVAVTTCAAQTASTYCLYLFSIDAAGAITTTKGTEAATDISTLPAVPASSVPIGAIKVLTGAGGTATIGAINLAVTGNIAAITFYNFVGMKGYITDSDLALTGL